LSARRAFRTGPIPGKKSRGILKERGRMIADLAQKSITKVSASLVWAHPGSSPWFQTALEWERRVLKRGTLAGENHAFSYVSIWQPRL